MALITVASMPMESAAARSTPSPLAVAPRMMFPPPITMPSSTPGRVPSAISPESRTSAAVSMPCPCSPARTSPLSFSSTRRRGAVTASILSDSELGEAPDDDVLAELGDGLIHEILHPAIGVADRRLLEQADLLVVLVDLSLDDLRENRLRLAGAPGLLHEDGPLPLDDRGVQGGAIHRLRGRGRHLHGQMLGQLAEVVRARHEVGLAIQLHQHPQLITGMDVAVDDSLLGGAARLLRGAREAPRAQHLDRL